LVGRWYPLILGGFRPLPSTRWGLPPRSPTLFRGFPPPSDPLGGLSPRPLHLILGGSRPSRPAGGMPPTGGFPLPRPLGGCRPRSAGGLQSPMPFLLVSLGSSSGLGFVFPWTLPVDKNLPETYRSRTLRPSAVPRHARASDPTPIPGAPGTRVHPRPGYAF
jgi:hypothetical protein